MWRNYLIVAFRSLAKNKVYSLINLGGLTIGLAASLLVLVYVRYELSYDKWIAGAENTYQVQTASKHNQVGDEVRSQMAPYPAVAALRKDFPQIDGAVYAMPVTAAVVRNGDASTAEGVLFSNDLFFDVIRLPFSRGDPRTALRDAGSIVLTESEADRRFGTADAIGRTLTLLRGGKSIDFRVTGILRDLPKNTHLRMNMVARVDFASAFDGKVEFLTCWVCRLGWVYVSIRPGTDPAAIQDALGAWKKRNIPLQNGFDAGAEQDWRLTNIEDVHFGAYQEDAMTPGNDYRTIATFAAIAILILCTACINFTNLTTARASQRAREVVLRKVMGARRHQLVSQFVGESLFLTALAMGMALSVAEILTPLVAHFLDADFQFHYFGREGMALPALVLVLVAGVGAGVYPAFFLARFRPASVLAANRGSTEPARSGRLRAGLVVIQFSVSIGLIICTTVIYRQTIYARTGNVGYARDHVLQVTGLAREQLRPASQALERRLRATEGVIAVGRTGIGIGATNQNNMAVRMPGRADEVIAGVYPVDGGFFATMGINLIAGRAFDEKRATDDATISFSDPAAERALAGRGVNIVVNRLAAERMGFKDPSAAIGKRIQAGLLDANQFGFVPATIVGVVENERFRSIHVPLEPIVFRYSRTEENIMEVRYAGNPVEMHNRVERVWRAFAKDLPFVADYSEDIVARLYGAEEVRTRAFAISAALALAVASLGLFGLAVFTVERRTREIGIRKVLGARIRDIVRLLTWQFSKPVILANVVAWPLAWWAMRDWLNTFDDRIALTPGPFVMAGLMALIIAVVTVAGHAIRVARANPIHALRYE